MIALLPRLAKKSRSRREKKLKDPFSKRERSFLMSQIRGKNTKFEKLVVHQLRRNGVRFSTHLSKIVGKPDIANEDKKVAIFLDSDFWHGWRFPVWKGNLSKKWASKIERNRVRDRRVTRRLRSMGWRVLRIWEHQLAHRFNKVVSEIEESLY